MRSAEMDVLAMVRKGLHDLAQPLSAMQCRLWLGTVDPGPSSSLQEALGESLEVCEEMIRRLRTMQDQVEEAASAAEVH